MITLCDTCSVLMLIRIAPNMFTDSRFECFTVPEVVEEIFRTQRFKTRYPWRSNYKNKIKTLTLSELENEDFKLYYDSIQNLHEKGVINNRTGRFFNLSHVDRRIAAYSTAHNFLLNSTDDDLCDFVSQEFETKTITPLGVINVWLEKRLIEWDNRMKTSIEDWDQCAEPPQPLTEAKKFKKITGFEYIGQIKKKYQPKKRKK